MATKATAINTFLLTISIILILFIIIIIIFYVNEKNVDVQQHLENIQKNLTENYLQYDNMINKNYQVKNKNNIIIVDNFLSEDYFQYIRKQFDNKQFQSRDFIIRKASGVNFFKLHQETYDGILEIYYSNYIITELSKIIKKPIQRISLGDPNAASLLIYTNKGDHIDWHKDFSNIYGDRYVVLYTIVNEDSDKNGKLSENIFKYKENGKIQEIKMKENSLVIFKGSEILHKSTAVGENESRILLSMVFCDICQEKKNIFNIIYEKTKNYIVYG